MIYQGSKQYPVHEVIIHCSATKPEWMENASPERKVEEIRRWHVEDRGWRDIGYHWIVDRGGQIIPGRDETVIGAHVQGHNRGTIGICLLGGFGSSAGDRFEEHFTANQKASTWRMIRDIADRTDLQRVTGHNRYAAKACPGFEVPLEFPWPPKEEKKPRLLARLERWFPW